MNATKGYFSLVQFCPDISRLEAANVGVILLAPHYGFIKVRMSTDNDRVRRFFGRDAGGSKRINMMKQSLANRIQIESDQFKSAEDLKRFAGQLANNLTITNPRFVKVSDPEQDLEDLFKELVGGWEPRQRRKTGRPVPPQ